METQLGKALLRMARQAIRQAVGVPGETLEGADPHGDVAELLALPGAVFVTLTMKGELRGCIGSLQAYRSLGEDCKSNAVAAALKDTRFSPLTDSELDQVQIEVSVLSTPKRFPCASEADACHRLLPGVHGVILGWGRYRATFLPQVWEQLPDPKLFLASLKRKAGLPQNFWSPDLILEVYQVEHVQEGNP
jgi:AmmeMemoRadiSam system protein A